MFNASRSADRTSRARPDTRATTVIGVTSVPSTTSHSTEHSRRWNTAAARAIRWHTPAIHAGRSSAHPWQTARRPARRMTCTAALQSLPCLQHVGCARGRVSDRTSVQAQQQHHPPPTTMPPQSKDGMSSRSHASTIACNCGRVTRPVRLGFGWEAAMGVQCKRGRVPIGDRRDPRRQGSSLSSRLARSAALAAWPRP